uniref:Odorant receptor n=1 Tax=Anomala corpulenta TaxID=931571 RepID=A0A0E3U357_9SCAR|nr:odorant receptor 1 [Anomala corpulenta]
MSWGYKIGSFLNSKILKNEDEVFQDDAKYITMFSQVFAKIINLWPGDDGVSKKFTFGLMLTSVITQELSLVMYLLTTKINVDVVITSMASMIILLQSIVKSCVYFYNARKLKKLIQTVRKEFWPANIMGETTHNDIKYNSKILSLVFVVQYASAILFLWFSVLLPLAKPGRKLPHTSWFPFDSTVSPLYEIIYVWEVYLTAYINANIVCSYDTLFCSICGNCISQFRLLSAAVKCIGISGKENQISNRLLRLQGVDYNPVRTNQGKEDRESRRLLVICVNHHQKLIKITQELNEVFGPGHLAQFFASALGTCTACYKIPIEKNPGDLFVLIAFYIAHVSQLLEYCALSHELSYWGIKLGDAIFESFWYIKKHSQIRKCLPIIILRCQRAISMNALGIFELNYPSFLIIMRFTFSLYTFFNNMSKSTI